MLRKSLVLGVMAVAAMIGLGQTAVAEEISGDMLAQMGLGDMQSMSDEEGTQVRGEGLASVWGLGLASVILSSRIDGHQASSGPFLNASASGDSLSDAAISLEVALGTITANLSFRATAQGYGFAFGR